VLGVQDVSGIIHIDLTLEEACHRLVTDGDEGSSTRDLLLGTVSGVLYHGSSQTVLVGEPTLDLPECLDVDLGVIGGAFVHHLRRSKTLAPVDDGDLARESGEKGGLLHRRVTATDHDNLLVAEESAVTGRAAGDPSTLVLVLALDAEPDGLRTGADDDSLGSELLAFDPDPERPLGEVDPLDVLVVNPRPKRSACSRM